MTNPAISICIPVHNMDNREFFLRRLLRSIETQTFKDYEVIITEEGKASENTNAAIKKAKGDLIKILQMDDYLAHPNSLMWILDVFNGGWLVTGNTHNQAGRLFNPRYAEWTDGVREGINTIGSLSLLAFENKNPLLLDEKLSWLLDTELYTRLFERYGKPTILNDINVVIGIHEGQLTNTLTDEEKMSEHIYLQNK